MQDDYHSTGIAILGSTGSVGKSTLDIVARNPERFHVVALGARHSIEELLIQVKQFAPSYVVVTDAHAGDKFKSQIKQLTQLEKIPTVIIGSQGLNEIVTLPEVDCVMAAIVGAAGLLSTLAAAQAGKTVLLANKEALVMSGELLIATARQHEATLLPIDSEHNAVFQCMHNHANDEVIKHITQVTLTASGGPFLTTALSELPTVTPDQACAHPKWAMGRKISVDSATMMNKGLEVIEACLLFGLEAARVTVVIHPQSIVHAMVTYRDGSILAHMGYPDMRVPIAHAMAWPQRINSGVSGLDMTQHSGLEFFQPDLKRFPCLELAIDVQNVGGTAPTVMNAANEIAVQSFLDEHITFTQIYEVVADVVERVEPVNANSVEAIIDVDQQARQVTHQRILQIA